MLKHSAISLFDTLAKQTRVISIDGRKLVEKHYHGEPGVIKWYIIVPSSYALGVYPFKLKPMDRLESEVAFMRSTDACFFKPELVLVDYVGLRLIREYVNGHVYGFNAPPETHFKVAEEIGKCHELGWALGDTKTTNFVYSEKGIYIVDAEQSIRSAKLEHYAWDLLVYFSTLSIEGYIKALYFEKTREEVFGAAIKGYLRGNSSHGVKVIERLTSHPLRYLLYLLIPFPLNYMLHKKLEEFTT